MRVNFDRLLAEPTSHRTTGWDIEANLYMSFWYAAIYVVIEGWQELRLQDAAVDALIASSNTDLLRRYRNGVFHFQAEYHDDRFRGLIEEGHNVVEWIRALNVEFGRFFLDWIAKNKGHGTSTGTV